MMLELKNQPTSLEPLRLREENELGKMGDAARLFVYRRYAIILFVALSVIVAGFAYLKVARPMFTAAATIDIVNREGGFLQQQATLAQAPVDLQREILLAKSTAVAERVVKKLRLQDDPEFTEGGLASRLRTLWSQAADNSESSRLRSAILAVQAKTRITGVGGGSSIEIAFTNPNAARAADIANALADSFIETKSDADADIRKEANDWLINQSNDFRKHAEDAEAAVAEFTKANNLVTVDGKLLDQQRLGDVNNRISAAKDRMIDAQYKFKEISDSVANADTRDILDLTSTPEILNDPTIAKLRQRYMDTANEIDSIRKNFGKDPQKLRDVMASIKAEVLSELPRLQEAARNDYQLALNRYTELLAEQKTDAEASQRAGSLELELKKLQGTAQNYRTLYENFLQHSAVSIQEVSFPVRAAQISERASAPPERSWPKTNIVLALASLGGLGLGVAAGLLRDFSDRTYRTGAQFEAATQLKCIGLIPRSQISRAAVRKSSLPADALARLASLRRAPIWWKAKVSPNSRFVSELVSVVLALRSYSITHGAHVIGMTSALPGEGKSTLTASLGVLMAQSGYRVAIVDLDFHIGTLTEFMAPPGVPGLLDVLSGSCALEDIMIDDSHLDLTIVPGGSSLAAARPGEMARSTKLRECIARLRQSYDYVLVDLPPLIPVADVRATSEFIEGYILTVEWAKTNGALAVRALDSCREIRDKFVGGILNKINFKTLSKYDSIASLYYMKPEFARYRDQD
jgi:succinoglycan biosynthesis transport protein ExoP